MKKSENVEQVNEIKKSEKVEQGNESKPKNYTPIRQSFCFIYQITKL